MEKINYKYTPDDFIKDIVSLYDTAKSIQINKQTENIDALSRGRNHSISSKVEDLFAYFLMVNLKQYLKKDTLFFIDQKIIFTNDKTYFYPDIAIVCENQIVSMFDLKTDLGYKRSTIISDLYNKQNFVNEIKNKQIKITDGQDKTKVYYYKISNNIKYETVVLSDLNISKNDLQIIKNNSVNENSSNIYFLSSNEHLNFYNKKNNKEIKIYYNEFDNIMQSILISFNKKEW